MSAYRVAVVTLMVMVADSVLRAAPLDKWFKRESPLYALNGVVYGNGLFVAVGNGVWTSPDGSKWTSHNAGGGMAIAWGNGRYVAVGLGKSIFTSPDGTNWTKQSSGDPDWERMDFLGVGYGNGLFVAVGNTPSGRLTTAPILRTSAAGENWVNYRTVVGNYNFLLSSVAYGNGKFVVNGNISATSSNGVDWVWPQNPIAGPPSLQYHMAFGVGHFVSVSSLGDIRFDDSWIQQGWEVNRQTKEHFYNVAYGNGYYVAVGETYDNSVPTSYASLIKVSSDGTNWTSINVDSIKPLYGVAYGQNTFVAVGHGIIFQSDHLLTQPTFLAGQTARSVDGSITLAIQSPADKTITVESSEDLAGWRPMATVTNLGGVVTVTDTNAQSQSRRFYRARLAVP